MNKKLITGMFAVLMTLGMASAQATGDYGDYALSEQVNDYDDGPNAEQAFNFSNLSDQTVDVELLNNGEVVANVESVELDSTGFGWATSNESGLSYTYDQIAVYTEDASNIGEVTHYTNYGTGGESDTSNYMSSTVFSTFNVVEKDTGIVSGSVSFDDIIGVVMLMSFLGLAGKQF